MSDFQIWLVSAFASLTPIGALMRTRWVWPIAESVHFIGLALLVGTIFLFDLRLLGIARGIAVSALHKLVPFGVLGFVLTAASGVLFLATEPDQYIYNPSFHLKMLFMAAAGLNAAMFYLTSFRRVTSPGAPGATPRAAKLIAALSIALWLSVIVAGRLLTFYRPWPCGPEGPGAIATCLPNYEP